MTIIITATCIGGCGCDGLSLCRTVFCESHNHNIHGKVQHCQLSHSSTPEHTSGTTSSSTSKIMHGTPSPPFQRRIPAWTNRMPPHWPKIGAARSSLSQTRAQPITSILNFWPLFCMKMNSRHGKIVENYPTAGERRKPAVKERGPWGKKHNLVGWLFIVNIYLSSQINKKMTTYDIAAWRQCLHLHLHHWSTDNRDHSRDHSFPRQIFPNSACLFAKFRSKFSIDSN